MQIKAVTFDFGGVIEVWNGRSFIDIASQMLGISTDEFRKVYFTYNHLSNVQNRPWEEVFMEVVSTFDDRKEMQDEISAVMHASQSQNRINTELLALFPLLRGQGLKVGILSNATSELREKLVKHGILDLVDEAVISGEIGFQKPHKEAFEFLFDRLNVHPNEAVFVDDSLKSLEKAEEIGYTPIHYKDNEQLRRDLIGLGISL